MTTQNREPLISLERALALDKAMEDDKVNWAAFMMDGYEQRRQANAMRLQGHGQSLNFTGNERS